MVGTRSGAHSRDRRLCPPYATCSGIKTNTASYAGLTRVSILFEKSLSKGMDCRVKPGNDAVIWSRILRATSDAPPSHRAIDPRDLDSVAEPADAQNLLPLADG